MSVPLNGLCPWIQKVSLSYLFYSLPLKLLLFPCCLTRFTSSARSLCSSLLRMWCSALDVSELGPSAAEGWSCIHKEIDINIQGRKVMASPCRPSCLCCVVCVCLSVCPHLEFQCIEGVFGGAAERPLGDHLHRVEQLMALSPQRTSDL